MLLIIDGVRVYFVDNIKNKAYIVQFVTYWLKLLRGANLLCKRMQQQHYMKKKTEYLLIILHNTLDNRNGFSVNLSQNVEKNTKLF